MVRTRGWSGAGICMKLRHCCSSDDARRVCSRMGAWCRSDTMTCFCGLPRRSWPARSSDLDREVRNKPAGLRTMALVALGSAVFVRCGGRRRRRRSTCSRHQGVITGIGFLGAGSIIRGQTEQAVQGLTTAASIWLAAAVGVACGLAVWPLVLVSCCLGSLCSCSSRSSAG